MSSKWFRASPVYDKQPEAVDLEAGIIRGAALTTVGPALGHGVNLDREFIDDVVAAGNDKGHGVKVRFGHPNMSSTALGTFLGRAKNLRADGDIARGDVFLSNSAADTPSGNLKEYVSQLANDDPEAFGMSIAFTPGRRYHRGDDDQKVFRDDPAFDDFGGDPFVEMSALHAVDMVDDPAANAGGLFSKFGSESWAAEVTDFLDSHQELFEMLQENPSVMSGFVDRYNEYQKRKNGVQIFMDTTPEQTASDEPEAIEETEETTEQPEAGADDESTAYGAGDESTDADADADAEDAGDDPETDLDTSDPRAEFKAMVAEFGAEKAAKYFEAGLTIDDARVEFCKDLKAENESLRSQAESGRHDASDDADDAVGFDSADEGDEGTETGPTVNQQRLGSNIGAYADTLKLKDN